MRGRVVALGGGHGLAVTLRAAAPLFDHLTGIVSTSDDGGSSGRLRRTWDVPGVGDVRRCLAALVATDDVWHRLLGQRFDAGELDGHAVGNLLLLALATELGDLQAACDEIARAAGVDAARLRLVPVTGQPTVLHGRTGSDETVVGQVAVSETPGVQEVWVQPHTATASAVALDAIRGADVVLLGPGSLYTSVLAAAVVGDVRKALADTHGRIVYLANLRAETVESRGYDVADHVAALDRHGVHPDLVVAQEGALEIGCLGVEVVQGDLAGANGLVHDPAKLGALLARL